MFADGGRLDAEQLGHCFLRKPNSIVFNDGVYRQIFFGGAVNQKPEIVFHCASSFRGVGPGGTVATAADDVIIANGATRSKGGRRGAAKLWAASAAL